ncbi:MAG TPA: tyrosine-type recombinase/integrase [Candidatus Angelobacter sp.]
MPTFEQFIQERIYLTLIDTWLRVEEALSLKRSSVSLDQMLLTVHGKGWKQRLVPFSFEVRKVVWKFISKQDAAIDHCSPAYQLISGSWTMSPAKPSQISGCPQRQNSQLVSWKDLGLKVKALPCLRYQQRSSHPG